MEFSQTELENKTRFLDSIRKENSLLKEIINRYLGEDYSLKKIEREWEPGGGSSLFQIQMRNQKIFLKVMNLNINIESKLEKEKAFIKTPSIRNEYDFIREIRNKTGQEHIPAIIFYEEINEFGFLAYEWLEPFDKTLEQMTINEVIETYNEIDCFVNALFDHDIVHTDIHENNIRFRGKTPVIIDYGETRYFRQDLQYHQSLDYTGINKYGNVDYMPVIKRDTVEGYTCLLRLKKVFDKYLIKKLRLFADQCNFDDTCPFNKDILQEPDSRIYQSVDVGGLKIEGQRPLSDEREKLVTKIASFLSFRYSDLIYMDIGCNVGIFCLEVSRLKRVMRCIGIEAFENYVTFATGLKFLKNVEKVSYYKLKCGEDIIHESIEEIKDFQHIKKFITLMSVYHHISNKEKCLESIKHLSPAGVMIEFATQDRYYPERGNWSNESEYIKNMLNCSYSITIIETKDYKRPLVLFTNDRVVYSVVLLMRIGRQVERKFTYIFSLLSALKKDNDTGLPYNETSVSYGNAIDWLKKNVLGSGGIAISSKQRSAYPEVTGYIIPTLYQWGEKELARKLTGWLIEQQNDDGSFSAPDGTPYTFDTGQVIRGFVSALEDVPEVKEPLIMACEWILAQIQTDGRLTTPSTDMWGDIAREKIHLYVLPALAEVGEKLNKPRYAEAAKRVLQYYRSQKDITDFDTLSHFHAYVIEALCDLGETGLAKEGMQHAAAKQRKDGSIPAYRDVSWVCSTGLAQYALVFYKLGMRDHADKAVSYLEKIQNNSGGFDGSYGKGADYFQGDEISWAAKYFLDAYYWKVKTSFGHEIDIFPDTIDETDGRVREILSFAWDLNGKKVIDVGCGKGRFLRVLQAKFPDALLHGFDVSEEMLRFCPGGIETACGSMLDIKYPDAFFDFVYCVEALEHALRVEAALKEMVRVLKRGGKIIIIDKNITKLGQLKLQPWEQWFDPEEIHELLGTFNVEARFKSVAYENHARPDGLFIAWEGTKR